MKIMAQMFQIDMSDMDFLIRLFRKMPDKFERAVGMMLNEFAFETRKEAINLVPRKMTVRNKGFMKRSLVVKRAALRGDIRFMKSEVGSMQRPRFTGWKEQELGTVSERPNVATLAARGGGRRGIVKGRFRLRRGQNYPDPIDYPGESPRGVSGDESHRAFIMLRTLSRNKYKKPFLIRRYRKAQPGLYRLVGGANNKRLQMLQATKPKFRRPKRVKWLRRARGKMFATIDLNRTWAKTMKRVLTIR